LIFIGAGGGWAGGSSTFNVTPSFDASRSGGVGYVNGGILFPIPNTGVAVGPSVTFYGGNVTGDTANPPASPGFTYTVKTNSILVGEAKMTIPLVGILPIDQFDLYTPPVFTRRPPEISLSVGAASAKTEVTGTSGAFVVTDSHRATGITTAVGVAVPIFNTPLLFNTEFRYINQPTTTFNIPGPVHIDRNVFVGTAGLTWRFGSTRGAFTAHRTDQIMPQGSPAINPLR
jgi:hypothetical protein